MARALDCVPLTKTVMTGQSMGPCRRGAEALGKAQGTRNPLRQGNLSVQGGKAAWLRCATAGKSTCFRVLP